MISKTQIVMFAVAAFAITGMTMPSAFAVSEYADVNVGTSGTAQSDLETVSCGSGTCVAMISGSASQDYYTIWYGMYGSTNTCTVSSYSVGSQGANNESWGAISGLHSERYNEAVDDNETVVVINTYTSCN